MAGNAVSWPETQAYLDATDLTIRPGAPTTYVVPRRTGNSVVDVTSFHPGQATWSIDTFLDCMYQLRPPPIWYQFKATKLPGQKLDNEGKPIWVDHPELPGRMCKLLDFKILPDKIGTREEWWYFEQVRRLDPRVRWVDILVRMERQNRPLKNHLNNFASRTWRPLYQMISWHGTEDRGNETKMVLDKLSEAQKEANTTRGSTPGWSKDGWIQHPEARKGRGECRPSRRGKVYKSYKSQGSRKAQPSSKASKQLKRMLEQFEAAEGEEDRKREQDKSNRVNGPEFELRHGGHHDLSLDSQQSGFGHRSINERQILLGDESAIPAYNEYDSELPQFKIAPSHPLFQGVTTIEDYPAAFAPSLPPRDDRLESGVYDSNIHNLTEKPDFQPNSVAAGEPWHQHDSNLHNHNDTPDFQPNAVVAGESWHQHDSNLHNHTDTPGFQPNAVVGGEPWHQHDSWNFDPEDDFGGIDFMDDRWNVSPEDDFGYVGFKDDDRT